MSGRSTRGFTLIEVLVALLVFSILGFAVSSRVGDIINQTYNIERRTVAHWVTDNYLTRLRISARTTNDVLPTGRSTERVLMGGREWRLEIEVIATTHPWLRRVELATFEMVDDRPVGPIDQMVAFLGRY
ncbi:MAG: type II secretion system minor pseudopilin GspI [Pseudomonadales bacterium]|jgi:general secretion pathway protein I